MVSIHGPLGYEPNTLTTAPLRCLRRRSCVCAPCTPPKALATIRNESLPPRARRITARGHIRTGNEQDDWEGVHTCDPHIVQRGVRSRAVAQCHKEASRGFEPRSLDSESRVLTVTPRGQVARNQFEEVAQRPNKRGRRLKQSKTWQDRTPRQRIQFLYLPFEELQLTIVNTCC